MIPSLWPNQALQRTLRARHVGCGAAFGAVPYASLSFYSLDDMSVSHSLTSFQRQCERELSSALAAKGLALTDRAVVGESEMYVRASVMGTGIEIYIYEDEAQFHRDGKRAGVFEHQDFNDADQLQKAFICGVLEATDDI